VTEPGLDLHEWETEWQQLLDDAADAPAEALPELVRLIRRMLEERGYQLDEPVTATGEDMDILKDFTAAEAVARAAEAGEVDDEDVATALEDLQDIYDYLVSDRAPP
jgi:hypothetical protein